MFSKLKPHWPSLLLVPAVLTLFWPTLLAPSLVLFPTFSPFSDVMVIHWPKAHLLAQSWQAGTGLPYWTPLILSGMPLAANQLAMLAYPPAWLLLFFPSEPVFNWLFIFHLVWGGLGIYFLLRENFKMSALAALLGGLTFALNGKVLAHTAGGHVSMVAALGWLPWTVWGVQMLLEGQQGSRGAGEQGSRGEEAQRRGLGYFFAWRRSSYGWMILVAVSLAMQIVTHTLPVIYSVYLMGAMLIWQMVGPRREEARRRGGEEQESRGAEGQGSRRAMKVITHHALRTTPHASRLTFHASRFTHSLMLLLPGLFLATLLGAAQLLPLLELARYSNRSLSLEQASEFALAPAQLLVGLLLPTAQAGHEYVIYVGLIPLLLAAFGLSRQNRWALFYGLVFGFAVLFALGPHNPLHTLFYYAAPGFRYIRTPARIFFAGALALAVLVGFGVDRLAQQQWSVLAKKWLTRLTVALAPLALLVGLGLAFATPSAQGEGFEGIRRSALALAVFIPLGLSLILLRAQRVISAQITVALLGLLLFADLAWFDSSLLRFTPLEQALSPGRAAAAYLAQKPGYFRVYSPSYSLPMATAAAAGLHLTDGVEPVHLAPYDEFMARAGGYNDPGFSVTIPKFGPGPLEISLQAVQPNLKLLGLLNVTYLASAFPMPWPGLTLETEIDGTFIYRNELALPRAWVAHQAVPAEADWLAQLEALPGGGDVAVVEDSVENVQPSTFNIQRSPVEITTYSADKIELETEIPRPGWLVVSEIWYPGWQAMVNGSPQPVEKVNGLLRGLYLSGPGRYRVTLAYQPASVAWGNWISVISAGFLLAAGSRVLLAGWRKIRCRTSY